MPTNAQHVASEIIALTSACLPLPSALLDTTTIMMLMRCIVMCVQLVILVPRLMHIQCPVLKAIMLIEVSQQYVLDVLLDTIVLSRVLQ